MRGRSGTELLEQPVRVRGITLGRAVDLVLDERARRLLGFEVLCGDGTHRFLPIAAARLRGDEIEIRSALALLASAQLAYYREHGSSFARLRTDGVTELILGPDCEVLEQVRRRGDRPSSAG